MEILVHIGLMLKNPWNFRLIGTSSLYHPLNKFSPSLTPCFIFNSTKQLIAHWNRFISRQDLVSWRAKIEYELVPEPDEKVRINWADIFCFFFFFLHKINGSNTVSSHGSFLSKDPTFLAVQMSRKNIGFLDVKEIPSDALADLFADFRSDEKSIIRVVFG